MLFSSRFLACIWFLGLASAATLLPAEEFESLRVIASTLGKLDWSFDRDFDPCEWQIIPKEREIECNCTYENNTVCHVTKIYMKRENLDGSLPGELVRLPFLQVIDLTRNYLSGTIPPQWGSMQSLRIISLLGNRLTGQIPKELANITTLTELVLEANQFNGTFPAEFGNLPNLERILLNSNNLTGVLPSSLSQLTTLTTFRISDNNFTGSIPTYIQSWTNMQRLEIEASGLSGPIPSNLTSLTNLNDLRISDLNGGHDSGFPLLDPKSPASRDNVILRSCNLVGEIPRFIEEMNIDKTLDLSFNKLIGPIPPNLGGQDIYLAGNSLNGTVPDPMKTKRNIDLSYNNLTVESSDQYCSGNSPNLLANSNGNTTASSYCATTTCKPNDHYFFHINCGSNQEVDGYEADGQESNFYRGSKWGFSRMGEFLNPDNDYEYRDKPTWSANNLSISELYKDARLSPVSLTYFGFCLRNGNYTVKLHFAEIMFAADRTYRSLGRRVFDVYIQGARVLKDFNIVNAAGGVNKPHIENFTAVVSDHTLDIRFYWAGKGTTALPERSVYGPLISAISVEHDNYRPGAGSISAGAIVGIVMGTLFLAVLVLFILWFKGCLRRKDSMHHELRGLDLRTGSFTLRQIRAATNDFDPANKIGEGGFGPVYKGVLLDGQVIAVKQLSSKSKQGNREFINEIGMISALQHPNLVKLYGCCIEGNQLLLVYEYCENNSLARALFGPEEQQLLLNWPTRHATSIGIARGLAYLHEESRLKIVHRDIKATNVLLDGNLVPKISDFGLAKLDEEDNTHISTRIAGTFGYMAPEYAMRGYLTDKADVYSFGVVLLEIVSGRSNSSIRPKEESFYLLDWTNSLKAKGELLELVDPRLESNYNKEEVITAINVALLCTNAIAAERPSMSAVVNMLEGRVGGVPVLGLEYTSSTNSTKPDEVEMRVQSISMDEPWSASSSSVADLYPVTPDTSYWEKRAL